MPLKDEDNKKLEFSAQILNDLKLSKPKSIKKKILKENVERKDNKKTRQFYVGLSHY